LWYQLFKISSTCLCSQLDEKFSLGRYCTRDHSTTYMNLSTQLN
jgi:hypothetical protein